MEVLIVIAVVAALLAAVVVVRSVRIVPQARARNVERLGRYHKTLEPGLNFVIPFVDYARGDGLSVGPSSGGSSATRVHGFVIARTSASSGRACSVVRDECYSPSEPSFTPAASSTTTTRFALRKPTFSKALFHSSTPAATGTPIAL